MSFNFINSYCLDCKKESKFFYEELSKLYDNDKALNLGSLNQILDKITCSSCNSNNLEIKDQNNELLFNPLYNISCKGEDCGLPIPFTRIKIEPNTDLCTVCKQNGEIVVEEKEKKPDVPASLRGKCKKCNKGIVVVYQNSVTKEYFLGCSSFPSCRWSTNKYYKELNKE